MKKIFFLTLLLLINSCYTTKWLWDPSYEENLNSFFTNNTNQILIVGEKYQYAVNDEMGVIKDIIFSIAHNLVVINTEKTKINVDKNNVISGYIVVETLSHRIPRRDFIFLKSLGFNNIGRDVMSLQLPIHGERFNRSRNLDYRSSFALDQFYKVRISNDHSVMPTTAKVVLSPITIVLDAVISVGKIIGTAFSSN